MILTGKQEKFSRELAKGKSQYDAFCIAYPLQAKNSKRETIDSNASRLAANNKIVARVKELQYAALNHVKYDIEAHYNELERLQKLAEEASLGKYGDPDLKTAIKAVELKGKVKGLYVLKVESTNTEIPATKEELESKLIEIADREGLTLDQFKKREGLD
jgi:hypothetical protein